jgi:hypothetical protein
MQTGGAKLAALLLAVLTVATGGIAAFALTGHLAPNKEAPTRAQAAPPPPPPPPPTVTTNPAPAESVARTVPPPPTRVLIVATRGNCWVSAHRGTITGPVLLERTLRTGERIQLRARKIALELGASGNVDLTVNGKPRNLPLGTVDLTLG